MRILPLIAEGRLAAKAMVVYCMDNKDYKPELADPVDGQLEKLQEARIAFKRSRDTSVTLDPEIEALKNNIREIELASKDA